MWRGKKQGGIAEVLRLCLQLASYVLGATQSVCQKEMNLVQQNEHVLALIQPLVDYLDLNLSNIVTRFYRNIFQV